MPVEAEAEEQHQAQQEPVGAVLEQRQELLVPEWQTRVEVAAVTVTRQQAFRALEVPVSLFSLCLRRQPLHFLLVLPKQAQPSEITRFTQ